MDLACCATVRTSWNDEAVVNADACDARERDEGAPVFFYLGQTSHTHLSFAKLVATAFATAFFGVAAASSLGAAAFGAAAVFLRTGAAFGCAAARLLRAAFAAAFRDALRARGGLLMLLQTPWRCCCCCCCLMIRRRRSPGRCASDAALVCHRLRCYLNSRLSVV